MGWMMVGCLFCLPERVCRLNPRSFGDSAPYVRHVIERRLKAHDSLRSTLFDLQQSKTHYGVRCLKRARSLKVIPRGDWIVGKRALAFRYPKNTTIK